MSRPDPFVSLGVEVDAPAATVTGRWAIGDEVCTETAVVPDGDLGRPGVTGAAELWCLLAGVSYFKTAAPLRIEIEGIRTSPAEREFLRRFYVAGLDEFLPLFRSCNRSFHQDPARRLDVWCGTCDKCLFINLALAPFLAPEVLAGIFGGTEPLVQASLAGQLRVLVGMSEETRPFECVGDEEECREALLRTAGRPDRASHQALQELALEVGLVHRPSDPPPPAAVIPERYAPPAGLG